MQMIEEKVQHHQTNAHSTTCYYCTLNYSPGSLKCTSFSDIRIIVLFRSTSRDMHFSDNKNNLIRYFDISFIDATNTYFHNPLIA